LSHSFRRQCKNNKATTASRANTTARDYRTETADVDRGKGRCCGISALAQSIINGGLADANLGCDFCWLHATTTQPPYLGPVNAGAAGAFQIAAARPRTFGSGTA